MAPGVAKGGREGAIVEGILEREHKNPGQADIGLRASGSGPFPPTTILLHRQVYDVRTAVSYVSRGEKLYLVEYTEPLCPLCIYSCPFIASARQQREPSVYSISLHVS